MALGQTLATLRTKLKAEIGANLNVSTAEDTTLNQILDSTQEALAIDYSWPHLETRADVSVGAGSYTGLTLPTTINLGRGFTVETKYDDLWYPVEFGVGSTEYNVYDSTAGDTADPISRWRYVSATTFEVWPRPSVAQTVRFTGQGKPTTLSADDKVAVLDDLLIVYFAAAELCTRYNQKDAELKLRKAVGRLAQLRRNQPGRDIPFVLGGTAEVKPREIFVT